MNDSIGNPVAGTGDQSTSKGRSRFTWLEWAAFGFGIILLLVVLGAYFVSYAKTSWGRIASQSNMRQIGLSLKMYADANGGHLPATWTELILAKDIDLPPDVFVSPWSAYDESQRALSPTARAKMISVPGSFCCTYIYTAANLSDGELPDDAVLAIEPAEINSGAGAQLLFRDGSVEWIALATGSIERKNYERLIEDFANGVRPIRFHRVNASTTTQS